MSFFCAHLWWHPTPVLFLGKSHGQRNLIGCSPWDREESDTTEQLHFHFSLSCIREANGNPLQCFYLENPRDRGACWSAIYRVTQSRTPLKWLSSSSCNECILGSSNFFEEISSFLILLFSSISSQGPLRKASYLSLVFFGTLHSDGYIFPFLLYLLLLLLLNYL